MLEEAWDVKHPTRLPRLSKIVSRLHSQPHIGDVAEDLIKAQRQLWSAALTVQLDRLSACGRRPVQTGPEVLCV